MDSPILFPYRSTSVLLTLMLSRPCHGHGHGLRPAFLLLPLLLPLFYLNGGGRLGTGTGLPPADQDQNQVQTRCSTSHRASHIPPIQNPRGKFLHTMSSSAPLSPAHPIINPCSLGLRSPCLPTACNARYPEKVYAAKAERDERKEKEEKKKVWIGYNMNVCLPTYLTA